MEGISQSSHSSRRTHREHTILTRVTAMMQPRRKKRETAAPIIVIVEANPLVRTAVAEYLRECGYQVIETMTPAEATAILHSRSGIDIVLIDVDADDGAAGFSLARQIRSQWPQVKVLLSSGIPRTAMEAETLCEQGPTSSKPYDHRALTRRIRLLASKSGR
jgi:DNA-binding response OmpR family regulator